MLMQPFLCFAAVLVSRALAMQPPKGVAVYWGQNSGGDQERLRHTCERDSVDTVILSFLTDFPKMKLNFSNMCSKAFRSGLLHCRDISDDIKYCQSRGKTVLLSLGGDSGKYGFESDAEARDFAHTMYDTFGPGFTEERPFDDAVVDGYDFNMETEGIGYVAFAQELNRLHANMKRFYLTASPQCPFPDQALNDVLTNAQMSALYVQFYNNYCSLSGGSFNFATDWKRFAENASPNRLVQIYIGLPGAPRSAGSGYVGIEQVKRIVNRQILDDENFGGFALWDASSAETNKDKKGKSYDQQIKDYMNNPGGNPNNSTNNNSTNVDNVDVDVDMDKKKPLDVDVDMDKKKPFDLNKPKFKV
ncbi:hypothetical protein OXX80_004211 [Metschnikowia pulcherrima]